MRKHPFIIRIFRTVLLLLWWHACMLAEVQAADYVHISEIMYDSPLNEVITAPPYSNGEYIELYNAGYESVNLNGWRLKGDGSTENLLLGNLTLPAQSALIVAFRHSWTPAFQLSEVFPALSAGTVIYQNTITLKNTKEYIRLYDASGLLRDSVYYGNETSIKPISDRLIAENEDDTPGSGCRSVQRKNVNFTTNGAAVASHLHWTVSLARPFQTALAYTPPEITPPMNQNLPSGQNYIVIRTRIKSGSEFLDNIQYFDGLGRPVQTVQKGITPEKADLVNHVVYDEFGREYQQWLPVPAAGNNGAVVDFGGFQAKAASYAPYAEGSPYSEVIYEASPLNRVLGGKSPGDAWKSHPTGISYGTNTAGEVAYFYINSGGQLQRDTDYPAATLYKTETRDEDGKTNRTYKDKLGQVVMTRQAGNHDTYYVYNDLRQLAYVLPPLAADALGSGTYDETTDAIKKYAYVYRYDERGNQTYKRQPGCEPVYMVYDKADRLVLSQDGNQRNRSPKQWMFHKYDELGRLIISGIFDSDRSHSDLAQQCKDIVVTEIYDSGYYGYSWNKLPEIPYTGMLTVNYYDDYDRIEQHGGMPAQLRYEGKEGYSVRYINGNLGKKSAKGLLVGTRTKLLDGSGETITAIYYDYRGRVVQTRSTNHMGGYDFVYNDLDFTGKPNKTLKEHSVAQAANNTYVTELYTYTYDHAGRLIDTKYKLNSKDEILLAKHEYDELGRLKGKKRHNGQDSEEYDYNIRGWTTRIKSGEFEQKLYYSNSNLNNATIPYCFNGNIAATTWTYNGVKKAYIYQYDSQNRLDLATAYQISGYTLYAPNSKEEFNYDKHGNIIRLWRQKEYTLVDFLNMSYNGNQVKSIYDSSSSQNQYEVKEYQDLSNQQTEFLYDANGNMTADLDRDIVTIKYNLLNLPELIQFKNGNQIKNLYDAIGKKLSSRYVTLVPGIFNPLNPGQVIEGLDVNELDLVTISGTAYVGNMEYAVNRYFDWDVSFEPKDNISIKRVHNGEGYAEGVTYVTEGNEPAYSYYRRDHLGNNREVWCASYIRNNSVRPEKTMQRTQYYPSGLPWAESTGTSMQPYKFGGKEFVETHGYDMYDYHARGYYPAIMRFTTIDPLAEKYYPISPYVYCLNNPIRYTDPTGMYPVYDPDGNLIGTDDNGLQGHAIIMNKDNFKQGMSYEDAMKHNLGIEGLANQDAIDRYTASFEGLKDRPDWDGYLTLSEANDWYRNGNGQPLFVDLNKIDLSGIVSLGEKYVGQVKTFNLLFDSGSLNDGLVYGNITLKRYPNHTVRAFADTYDFDMKSWGNPLNWGRNIETIIGQKVAGQGTGYEINIYGSKKLTPILPWIK